MDSPKEVIRQFERLEESAKTQEVVKEYLKALVLTGRLEGANLGHLLSRGTPPHPATNTCQDLAQAPLWAVVLTAALTTGASGGAGGNAGRLTLVAGASSPLTLLG